MTVIVYIASTCSRSRMYGSYAFLATWPGGRISKCGPLANVAKKRECDIRGIMEALKALDAQDLRITSIIIRGKYESVEPGLRGMSVFQDFMLRRPRVIFLFENDQPVNESCYQLVKGVHRKLRK